MARKRHLALISWLRDCLAAERSNRGITRITGAGIKRRRMLEGRDDALGGPTGMVDLALSVAEDLAATAMLYRRECELWHGSWIIAGQAAGATISAPVMLHRVRPEALEGSTFPIDPDDWRLNPALHSLFDLPADFERELATAFAGRLPGLGGMLAMVRLLGEAMPELDCGPADTYPQLAGTGEIEASSRRPGLRLHPAAALLLAERSPQVRGVLDELLQLAEGNAGALSPPLRQLLDGAAGTPPRGTTTARTASLPAHLSAAQAALLESAATMPLTLCHGPPGTGKTFTLAAAAIEHALRDQAVLVVCRSAQAADVVERMVGALAGTPVMTLRTGNRAALAKLREHIDRLLAGAANDDAPRTHLAARRERELRRHLAALDARTTTFESALRASLRRGRWFDPPAQAGLWTRFQQWRHSRTLRDRPLLMDAAGELLAMEEERIAMAATFLETHRRHLLARLMKSPGVRPTLRRYRNALRKRGSGAQQAALATIDPQVLLKVFPIWIVESDDLHRLLPLQPGLFPLVVIDEASQCDTASALPVLQRGKRALVCGDPQQLRHLSFLSGETIARLADRHGPAIGPDDREAFHFRHVSLIDAVLGRTDASHFLSEHFRSRPELIAFSNQRFYGGRLRLMRDLPPAPHTGPAGSAVLLCGERDADGVNRAELTAAADFLGRWLEEETRRGGTSSVGFLSPLRAQVDAFEQTLRERLGQQAFLTLVRDHDLAAATAHGFQGSERDLMLVSLGLGNACPPASRRFIERDDVFNVSITRARDQLVAFCSLEPAALPAGSLIRDWLATLGGVTGPAPDGPADAFIRNVADQLRALGFTCETGRSAAGVPIDLLVADPAGRRIALDLVGQRGRAGEEVPMHQVLLLRRTGLRLYPLGIGEWKSDAARCLRAIRRRFGRFSTTS